MIELLQPGMFASVQDLGRIGYAHLGVPRSGAVDMRSLTLANRLVGNEPGAAALELTFGRAVVQFRTATRIALTGAITPARLNGQPVPAARQVHALPGQILELDIPKYGLRNYLAIAGGIDVPPTLGSRSTDTLSGLGPPPLEAGQVLQIGSPRPCPPSPDVVIPPVAASGPVELSYRLGPRDDWFAPDAIRRFEQTLWEVTSASNRVGVRLAGDPLVSQRSDQLASEGMVLGSIEVPPSGQPIVFLADHPTTGGYPVVGVVDQDSIPWLAQAPPGLRVRFVRSRSRNGRMHCPA